MCAYIRIVKASEFIIGMYDFVRRSIQLLMVIDIFEMRIEFFFLF